MNGEGILGQGKPAKKIGRSRRSGDRAIVGGDIIVTAVAGRYAIGRMTMDGDTQQILGSQQHRADALKQACAVAGTKHQVFLYPNPGTPDHLLFDCPKIST
jgi:hypothetical protein